MRFASNENYENLNEQLLIELERYHEYRLRQQENLLIYKNQQLDDFADLVLHNSNISVNEIFEENQKLFNQVYLGLLQEEESQLTETQEAIIDNLAFQCFCLLYTSPSPRDRTRSRMPSSA